MMAGWGGMMRRIESEGIGSRGEARRGLHGGEE